jgi:uncharacterized protein YggT (Ycf19 family)
MHSEGKGKWEGRRRWAAEALKASYALGVYVLLLFISSLLTYYPSPTREFSELIAKVAEYVTNIFGFLLVYRLAVLAGVAAAASRQCPPLNSTQIFSSREK